MDSVEAAYRSAQWMLATIGQNARAQRWCKDHGMELRVMTTDVDSSGGYLVPDEMEQSIIDLRASYGLARRLCRRRPMASDTKSIPKRTSGVTAYFVNEDNSGVTASDKGWGNVNLVAKTLAALSLTRAKARGGDIRVVYSAADALQLAREPPCAKRIVVFRAVGVEGHADHQRVGLPLFDQAADGGDTRVALGGHRAQRLDRVPGADGGRRDAGHRRAWAAQRWIQGANHRQRVRQRASAEGCVDCGSRRRGSDLQGDDGTSRASDWAADGCRGARQVCQIQSHWLARRWVRRVSDAGALHRERCH
jgi:hypothetical protein